jgi:hypothetical protein
MWRIVRAANPFRNGKRLENASHSGRRKKESEAQWLQG